MRWKVNKMDKTTWIMLTVVIIVCTTAWLLWPAGAEFKPLNLKIPETFTAEALQGGKLFKSHCQKCHGANGVGTDRGPPLIHVIYEPNHHSDGSFYHAVAKGVTQHHWPYGNMPALPDVRREDAAKIICYVRELQVANGIK